MKNTALLFLILGCSYCQPGKESGAIPSAKRGCPDFRPHLFSLEAFTEYLVLGSGEPFHPKMRYSLLFIIPKGACTNCVGICLEFLRTNLNEHLIEYVAVIPPEHLQGPLKSHHRTGKLPSVILEDHASHFESSPLSLAVVDWQTDQIIATYEPQLSHPLDQCLSDFVQKFISHKR